MKVSLDFGFGVARLARFSAVTGGAVLLAAALAGPAAAQLSGSRHDLTPTGANNKFTPTSGVSEICVFCHTPHGSDITAIVPLWNRKLAAAPSYQTYSSLGTSTLMGGEAPVGSISMACLSCHDGQTAMNSIINAPGSGGYNAAGAIWAGSWSGSTVDGTGKLNTVPSMIGTDLRDDHPISIQYGGGQTGATVALSGAFRNADFNAMQTMTLNGDPVWWVDTAAGAAGAREKTDIMLYTRTEAGSQFGSLSGVPQPFVECGSCHDPHGTNAGAATFLRVSNASSAVCLACHNK
jgi:predicted CXXCH cytochrome family protein